MTSDDLIMVRIAADASRLKSDMDAAKRAVGDGMDSIRKDVESAGAAIGKFVALAGTAAVVGFGALLKGAIDAGDHMKEFSQKTGVAVEDVAGLQLAFKQGGVEGEALQGAIAKLSKKMAEGGAGFDQLGVQTRNADGSLRDVKAVLYDVADATAVLKDGAGKTALVQEIFGKAAAGLIPTLNEGADGMRSMAEMADKLGLSMSAETADAADGFNDTVELLGLSMQGVARRTMAELIPTLNSLAGTFLTNITEGDTLKKIAEGLAGAFKLLYTGVVIGIEAFSTFGKLIGGVVAQSMAQIGGLADAVMKVLSGDFKGALDSVQSGFRMSKQIGIDTATDISASWAKSGKTISDVWTGANAQIAADMAKANKQTKDAIVLSKEQEAAAKAAAAAAAAAAKAHAAAIEKATQAGRDQLVVMALQNEQAQFELDNGRKRTAQETESLKLDRDLASGKVILSAGQERYARALIASSAAMVSDIKWMEESRKVNEQALEALSKKADAVEEDTRKQVEANALIGKTASEIDAMKASRLDEMAVASDHLALLQDDIDLTGKLGAQQRRLAQDYRDAAGAARDGGVLKAAQETADEWKKTVESVSSGLTDALFRGFEAGKGFFVNFRDSLINSFKTLILQPRIKAIFESVVGGGGLLGAGGAQAGAGGGLGMASNLTSLFGGNSIGVGVGGGLVDVGNSLVGAGFDGIGSSISGLANGAAGVSNLALGGAGLAGGLFGSLLGGKGSMGGSVGSSLGLLLSGGNPLGALLGGLGGGIIGSLFGKSRPYNKGGAYTANADGTGQAITGQDLYTQAGHIGKAGYDDFTKRRSPEMDAATKTLAESLQTTFGGLMKTFGKESKDISVAFRHNGQKAAGDITIGGVDTSFATKTKDASKAFDEFAAQAPKALLAALDKADIPTWAKGLLKDVGDAPGLKALEAFSTTIERAKSLGIEMSSSFDGAIAKLSKTGETLSDTINRLFVIDEVSKTLNTFGGVFSQIAGSSIEARESIISLAGGIDALIGKANAFVQDYYTKGEQTGLQAKQVSEALKAAGIDGSNLGSREDFRKLVESIGTTTEEQRKQVVALLDIGPAFAKIADELKSQGKTLGGAVLDAPTTAMLDAIVTPAQNTTQAVTNVGDQIKTSNSILTSIVAAVQTGNAAITNALQGVANASSQATDAARTANAIAAEANKKLDNIASTNASAASAPSYARNIGGA